ncbi:MAG: hypothetical protein PVJ66_00965 [Gammaproteobacteria bacterium]|jgi:hypothetical protein
MKSFAVRASVTWLWLLVSCTPGTNVEPGENTQSADASASGAGPAGDQSEAKPTDIVDRMLSPLDDAVDDINRDLNKGDADTDTGSGE